MFCFFFKQITIINLISIIFSGIPSSMLESVWSSMSNSVYSSPDSDYEESFSNAPESEQVLGLEVFIQAIESSKHNLFKYFVDFCVYLLTFVFMFSTEQNKSKIFKYCDKIRIYARFYETRIRITITYYKVSSNVGYRPFNFTLFFFLQFRLY